MNHRDDRFKEVPCQIAAVVPKGSRNDGGWTASEWLSRGVSIQCSVYRSIMLLSLLGFI